MIVANLQNTARIEQLHPLFKEAFDYVKTHDLLHVECGKIELKGKELFINVANPTLKKPEDARLELHHHYIDIQIVMEGKECFGWKAIEDLEEESQAYNPDKDVAFYADKPTAYFDLLPGQFAIFFPEDPHAPVIGEGKVRKLIVKVRID